MARIWQHRARRWTASCIGRHTIVSGFCAGQGQPDIELFVGWRKRCHCAGTYEQSGQLHRDGGSEFLGCSRTVDVREYYNALQAGFDAGSANPPADLLHALGGNDGIQLDAPPTVAANFAMVNGVPHSYLANFGRLVPGTVEVPAPVHSIHVKVPAAMGNSLSYLPFLGETQVVHGEKRGDLIEFILPPLERGAVVSVIGGK